MFLERAMRRNGAEDRLRFGRNHLYHYSSRVWARPCDPFGNGHLGVVRPTTRTDPLVNCSTADIDRRRNMFSLDCGRCLLLSWSSIGNRDDQSGTWPPHGMDGGVFSASRSLTGAQFQARRETGGMEDAISHSDRMLYSRYVSDEVSMDGSSHLVRSCALLEHCDRPGHRSGVRRARSQLVGVCNG